MSQLLLQIGSTHNPLSITLYCYAYLVECLSLKIDINACALWYVDFAWVFAIHGCKDSLGTYLKTHACMGHYSTVCTQYCDRR